MSNGKNSSKTRFPVISFVPLKNPQSPKSHHCQCIELVISTQLGVDFIFFDPLTQFQGATELLVDSGGSVFDGYPTGNERSRHDHDDFLDPLRRDAPPLQFGGELREDFLVLH
jgi:hypothetical protein